MPELSRKIHEQEAVKSDFYKQRDKLDAESKNRTATMEGELAVLKNALSEAEAKRVFYAGKDIQTAMDRCNKLEILQQEQESLVVEKDLLSSKNKEASVLHANLIANLKNELAGFENEKQKQLLAAETEINARREARGSIIDGYGRNRAMPPRRRKSVCWWIGRNVRRRSPP